MQYYNVHSHIFTMNNAPERFLHLYLPPVAANIIDKITNTQAGARSVQWLLSRFGGNGGRRYASFLKIGKSKNQQEVFSDLINQYDDTGMQFVSLTMDMEKCGAGPSLSGYEGQLEEILLVKKQYPKRLLVFLGIDPRWKQTGAELKATVERYFDTKLYINANEWVHPFVGLKIYPSMGFYPFDERLLPTFEWAAEKGVPVLSHCNYLGGIFNNDANYIKGAINSYNPYTHSNYTAPAYINEKKFIRKVLGTNTVNNNLNTCSYFMEPHSFKDVFNHFKHREKPLKVCLAHYGGGNQILDSTTTKVPHGVAGQNWFKQIQQMFGYKGLYTDVSYALHDSKVHSVLLDEIKNPVYGERIMFGTDYFMTVRELEEKNTYGNFKKKAVEAGVWDHVAGTNVAAFLKSDYF